jgi:hypothetical protein
LADLGGGSAADERVAERSSENSSLATTDPPNRARRHLSATAVAPTGIVVTAKR